MIFFCAVNAIAACVVMWQHGYVWLVKQSHVSIAGTSDVVDVWQKLSITKVEKYRFFYGQIWFSLKNQVNDKSSIRKKTFLMYKNKNNN